MELTNYNITIIGLDFIQLQDIVNLLCTALLQCNVDLLQQCNIDFLQNDITTQQSTCSSDILSSVKSRLLVKRRAIDIRMKRAVWAFMNVAYSK